MKIELLRSLLDKGTINDNTLLLIKVPCAHGGSDHIMNVSGLSIEHSYGEPDNVVILNAELSKHDEE